MISINIFFQNRRIWSTETCSPWPLRNTNPLYEDSEVYGARYQNAWTPDGRNPNNQNLHRFLFGFDADFGYWDLALHVSCVRSVLFGAAQGSSGLGPTPIWEVELANGVSIEAIFKKMLSKFWKILFYDHCGSSREVRLPVVVLHIPSDCLDIIVYSHDVLGHFMLA